MLTHIRAKLGSGSLARALRRAKQRPPGLRAPTTRELPLELLSPYTSHLPLILPRPTAKLPPDLIAEPDLIVLSSHFQNLLALAGLPGRRRKSSAGSSAGSS